MTVYQMHGLTSNQIENFILYSRNNKLKINETKINNQDWTSPVFIRLARYLEIEGSNDIDVEILVQMHY